MTNQQQMVEDFHNKYHCDHTSHPTMPTEKLLLLRSRLIADEAAEFLSAASKGDFVEMVDALCDILYVTYGAAVVMGEDLDPIFAEVQASNMTKDGGGKDSAGKVEKGPNFREPDIKGKLREQGWDNG